MSIRFFGGWGYPADICGDSELVAKGYAGGVSMGGKISAAPKGKAPTFVVSALRDPGTATHPGGRLQRAQVIKAWTDPEGMIHQRVVDVAGGPNNASVEPTTCAPVGAGAEALCGVWSDPTFDPDQRAVYYARVVENPSCRQTGWACRPGKDRPGWCDLPDIQKTVQERGWTSPIWYDPKPTSPDGI